MFMNLNNLQQSHLFVIGRVFGKKNYEQKLHPVKNG